MQTLDSQFRWADCARSKRCAGPGRESSVGI
jgi:hypothetical protein